MTFWGFSRIAVLATLFLLLPPLLPARDLGISQVASKIWGASSQDGDQLVSLMGDQRASDSLDGNIVTGETGPRPGIHTNSVAPWVTSPFSGPIDNPKIANFGVIEDGIIYRSAQPGDADYRWLLGQGFKSIVSFRSESGDTWKQVREFGFQNYLWLDIVDETDPSDQQAEEFLDFVTDSANWPILIHCKVGLGRTGTMAALIRYSIDGWSMDEAIREARLYRHGSDLVTSQIKWLRHWEATHSPGCHRPAARAAVSLQSVSP